MTVNLPIYLDYQSTTPVDPRVLEAMLPYFTDVFGNAASRSHAFGWKAQEAVEKARNQVAQTIGADSREIVFTSGATESNNLAILGVAGMYRGKGRHVVSVATEHKSVLGPLQNLVRQGFTVTLLSVNRFGELDLDKLRDALTDETLLLTVMAANNEIGTLHPLKAIGEIAREKKILFHCDAAQGAGKIPLHLKEMGIDLLSLSGHKIYGPKGIGALYVCRSHPRVRLTPMIYGGGHEGGFRPGTLNVPAIVGMGAALELAIQERSEEEKRILTLRDQLYRELVSSLEGVSLNGHPQDRLPENLNLSFEGVDAEALMLELHGVALSMGAACTSAVLEPSHVLKAIGLSEDLAASTLRLSFGRWTTKEELQYVAEHMIASVKHLRETSPLAARRAL